MITSRVLYRAAVAAVVLVAALFLTTCRSDQLASMDPALEGVESLPESSGMAIAPHPEYGSGTVNYFVLEDFDESVFALSETDAPLSIVDYGPRGELPVEIRRPSVSVVFSQPMVPLARLGEPAVKSQIMSVDPPVAGHYRWYGSRVLAFEPDEDVVAQREFTVTVDGGSRSLGGRELGEDFSFSFRTEYLDIASFYPGEPEAAEYVDPDDVPPAAARFATISFTFPVDLGHISQFLELRTGGERLRFSTRRPDNSDGSFDPAFVERTVVVELLKDPPMDSEVTFVLLAGAASEPGFLPRPDAVERSYHTLRPFQFVDYSTYSWSFPRSDEADANPLYLEFSHPVDAPEVQRFLRVDLPDSDLSDNVEVWGDTIKINNLPVEYESTYRLRIDGALKDIYGRSLGQPQVVEVEVPAAGSYAYFPNTGARMLESQFPPRIIWEYQNTFDGVWKVASIEDPYSSFGASELKPYDFSDALENTKQYEILDISPWLNESGTGWVGLSWNFSQLNESGARNRWSQRDLQLQVTDLGVTVRYGFNRVLVWVHSLSTNDPVAGAKIQLLRDNSPARSDGQAIDATTDDDGFASVDLDPGVYARNFRDDWRDRMRVLVTHGDDRVVFRPNDSHNPYAYGVYNTIEPIRVEDSRMETFIFTDRGLYRPDETVTYRGIDRSWSAGNYSVYEGSYSLQVREQTYRSEPFYQESGRTSGSGGFYGTFELPPDLSPGFYSIDYSRGGRSQSITFQVANFRRASFQVSVTPPDRDYYLGDRLTFPMEATYLAGGGLSGASYNYYWSKLPGSHTPPGTKWDGFAFGPSGYGYRQTLGSGEGALAPTGEASVSQQTTPDGIEGKPYLYQLEVRVEDVDRQEIAGRGSVLVHPAAFYVGATLSDTDEGYWTRFLPAGESATLRYAFVRPDGGAMDPKDIENPSVTLVKHTWKVAQQRGVYGRINTRYELVDEVMLEEPLPVDEDGEIAEWDFVPESAGRYTLRLSATDSVGRDAVTELSFYATGSSWVRWGGDDANGITLVPDRDLYEAGDTAKIMVQSPLPEGHYLITTEREGIFDERIVELSGSANLIEVPITEEHVPVVYVAVTSYAARSAPPTGYFEPDLGKPRGYFGLTTLTVSPEPRTLDVEITPERSTYRPGDDAEVIVSVSRNGRPVSGAEVTFLAVDRGVLDLINYHVPDPIEFFYSPWKFPLGVSGADSRSLLIDPVTYEIKNLQGGDAEGDKMDRREDFSPLAVFVPFARTDEEGTARIQFTLPDTLTTYRATAVIVDENRFGMSEQELLVQNPVNVRTALPRGLRTRDTSRGGVIVSNVGTEPVDVSVSLEARGLVVEGSSSRELTVPGGESLEVPFTLAATTPGDAELVFTVRSSLPSGEQILAEQLVAQLPVVQPRVEEAFTVTGRTDRDPDDLGRPAGSASAEGASGDGSSGNNGASEAQGSLETATRVPAAAEEGVIIPAARLPGYGGLEVTLNSTRLAQVEPAIRYLAEYPFDYLDNRLTRILPQIVFGDDLIALSAGRVAYSEGRVEQFFASLVDYQLDDGGFSYNPRFYSYSSPYVSSKLAHYYALALENGYDVGPTIDIASLVRYLTAIQNEERVSNYVKMYALYAQALLGSNVESRLDSFRALGDEVGLAGFGFLGLAYAELGNTAKARAMLDRLRAFIRIGTRGLDITEPYESRYYFDSQVSQLALTQLLYLKLDPSHEMNERLAHSLQLRQRFGHWVNTADTAWAVIAYGEIISSEAGAATDMDVSVSLAGMPLMEAGFTGVVTEPVVGDFPFDDEPLSNMDRNALLPLSISKQGRGMTYYSATLTYALPPEVVLPRDEGLGVFARIENIDGDPVEGKTLELGTTYRYRITVSSSRNRQMVALRVPVPSGADILDASFVTTGSYAESGGVNQRSWSRETVYGESETYGAEGTASFSPFGVNWNFYRPVRRIMDDEVRYFFDEFYPGHQEVTFLFRTTTPGIYPTPPATALCMYEEEVFGRTAGSLFVIEE